MIRKLFNNRAFVIGLAICSGLLMVRSLAAPFMSEPDFADVESPALLPAEAEGEDEPAPEPAVWRADQSVLSGQLTWNDSPRRNPFVRAMGKPVASDAVMPTPRPVSNAVLPRLEALVAGPESLFAVLDDRIVREGDLIGAYQVIRIRTDGVRIASRSESHWLPVADMTFDAGPEAAEDELLEDPTGSPAEMMETGEPGP